MLDFMKVGELIRVPINSTLTKNMGEKNKKSANGIFGCIPHARGALSFLVGVVSWSCSKRP